MLTLKGVCHKIFDFRFFSWISVPQAGDNDTGDKFIAGHKNKDAMDVGSCQG